VIVVARLLASAAQAGAAGKPSGTGRPWNRRRPRPRNAARCASGCCGSRRPAGA